MNATTAFRKAQCRIRNTRGYSYPTRGGDQYDHRGFKKASRAAAKAEIAVQMEEAYRPRVLVN